MKYLPFLFLLILVSCGQKTGSDSTGKKEISNDTIPQIRQSVKKESVASYSEKVKNPLNDWRFAVDLYETSETFKFLMKIEYETINETDTIMIPNVGITPEVMIQKGEEPLSCIVGFKGKEGGFLPYKQVFVKDKQLRIKTIQHYARRKSLKKV